MFQHLVVPIDGSAASWMAVPIAARMAAAVDGKLDVVTVVDRLADISPARDELTGGLAALGELPAEPSVHVLANDVVAKAVAALIDRTLDRLRIWRVGRQLLSRHCQCPARL